jgi:hypothetical protein
MLFIVKNYWTLWWNVPKKSEVILLKYASIFVPENNEIIYVRFKEYWTRSRGKSNNRNQDPISRTP